MTIQNKPDEKIFASKAKHQEVSEFPDVERGWGFTFEQTGGIPTMEHFNALFKRIDEHFNYMLQHGLPEWSATLDYPIGAYVQYDNKTYRAKKASKNQRPDIVDSTYWVRWSIDYKEISNFIDEAGKGVPLGSIVAFPTQVRSPQGFLLCDGSTFEQDTYPDLYRTLGNSNKLPDLTKSDVGMLAYFPFDQIPEGWLPCNGDGITKADHPELFDRLKEKYGTYQSGNTEYARLPNAEDRFIRNADNGLTVGQKQAGTLTGFDSTLGWHSVFGPYIKEIKGTLKDTADQVGSDLVKNTEDYNAGIAWSNNRSEENDLNKANKNPTTDAHFIGVMRPHSIAFKLCIKVKSNFDQIRFFIKAYGAVTNIGNLNAGNLASEIHEMRHSYVSNARLKKVKKKILRISKGIQGETIWRGKTSDPVVCKTKNKGGVIYVLFNIKSKEVITKGHGFHSITRKEKITKGYGIHEDRWLSFPLLYADGTVIGDTDTGGTDGDYNYNTVIGIQTKAVKTEYGIYTGETEITITPLIDKDIGSWKDSWRDRTAVIKEVIALGGEEFNQEHPTESESTIDDF